MSRGALLLRQAAYGLAGFRRDPRAMVFSVVMPVVLLVLFGSVIGGDTQTTKIGALTIPIDSYFTAGITAYSIMLVGFSSLMISVVTARESGLLKRYRGTPMPSWVFLAAQILQTMVTIVLLVAVLLAIGIAAFGVTLDAAAPSRSSCTRSSARRRCARSASRCRAPRPPSTSPARSARSAP